jgi:hypothetical protein
MYAITQQVSETDPAAKEPERLHDIGDGRQRGQHL